MENLLPHNEQQIRECVFGKTVKKFWLLKQGLQIEFTDGSIIRADILETFDSEMTFIQSDLVAFFATKEDLDKFKN